MAAIPVRVDRVTKRFDKTVALDEVSLEIHEGEIFGLLGPNGAGKTTLIRTILDIIKPDSGRVEIFGRPFQPADRDRIGYLPEERGLYSRERVSDVLEYLGGLKGLRPDAAGGRTVVLSTHQMGLVEAQCTRVFMIAHGRSVLYGALRDIKRDHSSHTVRVKSSARYESCAFVSRVETSSRDQPAQVHLIPTATADEFLTWLVTQGAGVEYFEPLSTPLEEIFVTVAERAAKVP